MLRQVATGLVALLLAIYAVVLFAAVAHASHYEVERSIAIVAPPEAVLRHMARLPTPGPWSPNRYERALHGMDSSMKARMTMVSIAGSASGTTTVTWRRTGIHFFGAAITLVAGDDWVVGDVETSLAALKRLAESDVRAPETSAQ